VWQTLFLGLLLAGCSRLPTRGVVGDVSYNGSPITDGSIEFIPVEGTTGPSVGAPITDGKYVVPVEKGPMANGTYKVELRAVKDTGKFPPGPRYAKSMTIREDIIPAEYNSGSKVKKKIDPNTNPNRIDFHLGKSDSGSTK
jgi:hypothetical protein